MKKITTYTLILLTMLFTGCMSGSKVTKEKVNAPVISPVEFNKYDSNSDGVIDEQEFPEHVRNYDTTIAGHVLMIIITSVCVLTFGLVIMTCSREKTKKNT